MLSIRCYSCNAFQLRSKQQKWREKRFWLKLCISKINQNSCISSVSWDNGLSKNKGDVCCLWCTNSLHVQDKKASRWTCFSGSFSKEDRDKYVPMEWATEEGRGGEIRSCPFLLILQAARSYPREVLVPNHAYGWAQSGQPLGHRTNICHMCSLIPLQVRGFETIDIFSCTKKSQRNAPYSWRYKGSRKFCSARTDPEFP